MLSSGCYECDDVWQPCDDEFDVVDVTVRMHAIDTQDHNGYEVAVARVQRKKNTWWVQSKHESIGVIGAMMQQEDEEEDQGRCLEWSTE